MDRMVLVLEVAAEVLEVIQHVMRLDQQAQSALFGPD
jgi:hypothetical protein